MGHRQVLLLVVGLDLAVVLDLLLQLVQQPLDAAPGPPPSSSSEVESWRMEIEKKSY